MPTALHTTLNSFLGHNFSLVFFGGSALLFLLLTIIRPSRFNIFMFVGFLTLAFAFEYEKHLLLKIKTDMVDLIFPPNQRFTRYNVIIFALDILAPIALQVFGWGMVVLALIFGVFKRKKN